MFGWPNGRAGVSISPRVRGSSPRPELQGGENIMKYRITIADTHYYACEECMKIIRKYVACEVYYSSDWQGEECEVCAVGEERGGRKYAVAD